MAVQARHEPDGSIPIIPTKGVGTEYAESGGHEFITLKLRAEREAYSVILPIAAIPQIIAALEHFETQLPRLRHEAERIRRVEALQREGIR